MQKTQIEPVSDLLEIKQSSQNDPSTLEIEPQTKIKTNQEDGYQQEYYRWIIIVLVSIAFAINNLANNAIIPIASKVAKVYQLSDTYANLPIQLSFLINPIMNFTAGHFMDSKGLGISFRIGSILYAVGLLGYCLINYGYHFVLIGSILISLGQPLVMNSPAKIATFWFLKENRTLATGIISAINIVTLGVSLVFPAIFVNQQSYGQEAKTEIFNLYSKYFIAAVVNGVLIMFLMRQRPQRLPSAGAQEEKTHISKTIEIIRADRNLWKFFIAAMLLYGTFLSFGSTSNMLFKPYGFDDPQIAIFGVCLLVSGILGSVAYTLYIKKTIQYKKAIICACTLAVLFIITNALLMNLVSQQRVLISLMILGMGFNLIPMVPISYDLGCQLTFPVGQAQVVGIITGGSMIYTVVLTLTISSAVGFGSTTQSAINMLIYIILFSIGGVLYCMVNIQLKRRKLQLERQQIKNGSVVEYQQNQNFNDSAKDATLIRPLNIKAKPQSQQVISIQDDNINKSQIMPEDSQIFGQGDRQNDLSSSKKSVKKRKSGKPKSNRIVPISNDLTEQNIKNPPGPGSNSIQ